MTRKHHKPPVPIPKEKHSKFQDLKHALHKLEHRIVARVIFGGHLTYYGLVAAEAHGTYRYAAGAVGVLLIIEVLIGEGE
jgi:hypothetical protein